MPSETSKTQKDKSCLAPLPGGTRVVRLRADGGAGEGAAGGEYVMGSVLGSSGWEGEDHTTLGM